MRTSAPCTYVLGRRRSVTTNDESLTHRYFAVLLKLRGVRGNWRHMTGHHEVIPKSRSKQTVALWEDARIRERSQAFRRRFTLLLAAFAMISLAHGAPALGIASKKQADQEVSWLSPSDLHLLRRSYLRCLRARYAQLGYVPHETVLVAAFNRDLEDFTLLISPQDVKRAPQVLILRVPHIVCEWFYDGSATAR